MCNIVFYNDYGPFDTHTYESSEQLFNFLRRRIVRSCQRKTNSFHWSRIVLWVLSVSDQEEYNLLILWRACNLTAFIHSSTGPVVHPFSSCHEGQDQGSIPRGVLMWNRDSTVSVVSLLWWPRCDWSLWPHLRRALSQTTTWSSCWQCNNST